MVLSAEVLRPTRHRYDDQHDSDERAGRQRRASHSARYSVRSDGVVLRWRYAVTALCRSVRQLGYNGAAYVM